MSARAIQDLHYVSDIRKISQNCILIGQCYLKQFSYIPNANNENPLLILAFI